VLLGSPADRLAVEEALAGLPDAAARAAFILSRNDRLRSSCNDIEGRAHKLAKTLRE
jgi:anti-sigma factor RsiW